MLDLAVRIALFMVGWGAAFSCLMLGYLGWQLYWDSRR